MDATANAGFNPFRGGLTMAHLTRQPALSPERNASGFQGEVSYISNDQELGEILQSEAVKSCTFYTCRLVRPSFLDLCDLVQAEAIVYFPSSAADLAPELEDAEAVCHACNWVKIPRSFLSPLRTNTAARRNRSEYRSPHQPRDQAKNARAVDQMLTQRRSIFFGLIFSSYAN